MHTPAPPHEPAIPRPRVFFAASLALAVFFALWTWFALQEKASPSATQWLAAFDWRVVDFWRDWTVEHDDLWQFMVYLTDVGGVMAMTLMTVMGALWQSDGKHPHVAIAWLLIMIGVAILNSSTKSVFDRDRPPEALRDRAVLESNKSYPSGHSMGCAVGYGMLAYALILPQRHRPRRIVTLIVLSCLVAGIGFSRIYLRAHWFSDVVGGWAIGLTWLFFCLGWLERYRLSLNDTTATEAATFATSQSEEL